jgi:hypothetical protein
VVWLGPVLGCGLADATDELGSMGGEVCTAVGLGLVVVGSTAVPLSAHPASADNATAARTAGINSCESRFTRTPEFSRGQRR